MRWSRRAVLLSGASSGILAACATPNAARTASTKASHEWRAYGSDNFSSKYSALDQIDRRNVASLKIAWEWLSPDAEIIRANPNLGLAPGEFQATPIMADGVLYTSTAMSQVAAIDPATGQTIWVFDPETWKHGRPTSKGFQHRGVAWWQDGEDTRIIIATGDNRLIALNAGTGAKITTFGANGEVDLAKVGLQREIVANPTDVFGSTSPPTICRDVIVVGQYIHDRSVQPVMPPGDVRGFDVRTGALRWTFHVIPAKDEPGYETWAPGTAEKTGNGNVWTMMSADEELGLVYLPTSCPTNNFFGGERPGDNLYANSLVAVEAETGNRRWHFQIVHHDVWDYDLPCAPNLVDITVKGRRIKAVAQLTKHGFCFVFDRATGEPVWPIEERAVPQSTVAPERTSATQPFPTRPAPFERQGLTEADLIDFTPEIKAEAAAILKTLNAGPLFTPLGETATTVLPSWVGGANWWGAAVDPETGVIYIPSITGVVQMALDQTGKRLGEGGGDEEIAGRAGVVVGPRNMPLVKPPYGRITAIDLNTGDHLWMQPNAPGAKDDARFKPFDPGWIGTNARTGPLLTKTLLFMGEGPHDPRNTRKVLRAWDKANGAVVAEILLPDNTHGPPMTYMADGKQFIVCGMGFRNSPHRLVALALP
ncbi:MAG: pyrroloquinoline quinone-dependent dehydrogenase [Hyphomonadaceae bacterium]|nr:pyrroloquinoline quinone-dependent dehydrogenase [Hyphomonadaceae bacterium]